MGAYKGIYSSVETAHCLDVNRLVGRIKEAVKTSYSQKSGEGELTARDVSDAVEHNLKMFSLENQTFEFFSIANKLGGFRWLAKCPQCESHILKLYKPEGSDKYLCKDCQNLRPPSALYGPTRRYKEVIRPMRRMERIKEILATSNLSEIKTKALLDEYEKLEKTLKDSTFYRKSKLLAKEVPNQ
jgi:hypothetical protein